MLRPLIVFFLTLQTLTSLAGQNPVGDNDPVGAFGDKDVSRVDFILYLTGKYRSESMGKNLLKDFQDRILVKSAAEKMKFTVSSEEVEKEFESLDQRVARETKGKMDLTAVLARKNISKAEFKTYLEMLIALKKIIRIEKNLGPDHAVPDEEATKWLRDRAGKVKILSSPEDLPHGVVLKVGEEEVTAAEFGARVLKNLPLREKARELDRLLKQRLLRSLLGKHGQTVTEKDLDEAVEYERGRYARNPQTRGISYEAILKQLGTTIEEKKKDAGFWSNVAILKLVRFLFTSEDLKAYYGKNQDRLGPSLHVRHILARTRNPDQPFSKGRDPKEALKRIQDIRSRILGGDKFEKVARLASDDSSKFRGGEIGFIYRSGRMDPVFSEAAFNLDVGEISEPVRTQFGYHLIQVLEKKPAAPFEKVEDRVLRARASDWFKESVADAKLKNTFLDRFKAENKPVPANRK